MLTKMRNWCSVPRMNIEQAKQIPLEDFLLRLGFEPSRKSRDQLWYVSPFRGEKTPSFKVNPRLNAWYDFGRGEGGDILDLVKKLDGLDRVSDALARIDNVVGGTPLPMRQLATKCLPVEPPNMQLTSIGPVKSKSLLAYLCTRGIELKAVARFIQEAHYVRGEVRYFGLAFANRRGGYEIRSQGFKGTLGSKDITVIEGNSDHVLVFEGFFDFLTSVMVRAGPPDATIIVLNSVSLRDKALAVLKELNPATIELFRDHDTAGQQTLEFFQNALPNVEITDRSTLYSGHNDFNEWLMNQQPAKCVVS